MNVEYFDCKVKVGGSLYSEVRKFDISAAEVIFLRALHGDENVIDIDPLGPKKGKQIVPDSAIREQIEMRYRIAKDEKKAKLYLETFGRPHMPLPQTINPIEGTERGHVPKKTKRLDVISPANAVPGGAEAVAMV